MNKLFALIFLFPLVALAGGPNPVPNAQISGTSTVTGTIDFNGATVNNFQQQTTSGSAAVSGSAVISGSSILSGSASNSAVSATSGSATNSGSAAISGSSATSGSATNASSAVIFTGTVAQSHITGSPFVSGSASITGSGTLSGSALQSVRTDGTNEFIGTAGVGGTIALNVSGTGVINAAGINLPVGPIGYNAVFVGDSRMVNGTTPQGSLIEINNPCVGLIPTTVPAMLQWYGFLSNSYVTNEGVGGTGIETGILNYKANSFATTGNVTAGSNTVPITGGTSGMTGNFAVGFLGCPPGTWATLSGTTMTLHNQMIPALTPTISGTGVSIDVAVGTDIPQSAIGNPMQSAHQLSQAISGSPGFYFNAYGVNDSVTNTFTGSSTAGSGTLTNVTVSNPNIIPVEGYSVTGAGAPAGSVVVSNSGTVSPFANMVVTGTYSTSGSVAGTITPVASAWQARAAYLRSLVVADSGTYIAITIPPAFLAGYNQTFINSLNAGTQTAYGSGTGASYVIPSGSMSAWISGTGYSANMYGDTGLHPSAQGSALWAANVSQNISQLFPQLITNGQPLGFSPYNLSPYNLLANIPSLNVDATGYMTTAGYAVASFGPNSSSYNVQVKIGDNVLYSNNGPFLISSNGSGFFRFNNGAGGSVVTLTGSGSAVVGTGTSVAGAPFATGTTAISGIAFGQGVTVTPSASLVAAGVTVEGYVINTGSVGWSAVGTNTTSGTATIRVTAP